MTAPDSRVRPSLWIRLLVALRLRRPPVSLDEVRLRAKLADGAERPEWPEDRPRLAGRGGKPARRSETSGDITGQVDGFFSDFAFQEAAFDDRPAPAPAAPPRPAAPPPPRTSPDTAYRGKDYEAAVRRARRNARNCPPPPAPPKPPRAQPQPTPAPAARGGQRARSEAASTSASRPAAGATGTAFDEFGW